MSIMSASDDGVLKFSASPSASSERYIGHQSSTQLPESSGTLNPSINEVNSNKSFTIPPSDSSRFERPWPPLTNTVRQTPIEQSDQPQISFDDFQLYSASAFPVEHHPPPRTVANLEPSASPNVVGALIQGLGYNTSSSRFTHQPGSQPQYSQRGVSQLLYRQHLSRLPVNISDMKEEDFADLAGSEFNSPAFGISHDPSLPLSATVSPKDVFAYQSTMTPLNQALPSPYFDIQDSSYDTSPMFQGEDVADSWPPLFPDADDFNKQLSSLPDANDPIGDDEPEPVLGAGGATSGVRAVSRETSSAPTSPQVRRLRNSGSRRRRHPLPPIIVDETDPVAKKRARNTLAARKSRERKAVKMEELQAEIIQLKEDLENQKLETERWRCLVIQHGLV